MFLLVENFFTHFISAPNRCDSQCNNPNSGTPDGNSVLSVIEEEEEEVASFETYVDEEEEEVLRRRSSSPTSAPSTSAPSGSSGKSTSNTNNSGSAAGSGSASVSASDVPASGFTTVDGGKCSSHCGWLAARDSQMAAFIGCNKGWITYPASSTGGSCVSSSTVASTNKVYYDIFLAKCAAVAAQCGVTSAASVVSNPANAGLFARYNYILKRGVGGIRPLRLQDESDGGGFRRG